MADNDNASEVEVPDDGAEPQSETKPSNDAEPKFSSINRDELPPELQEKFDAMNRDYTQSKQKIAADRRRIEENERKAAALDLIMKNKDAARLVLNQGGEPASQAEPDEDEELMNKLEPDALRGIEAAFRKFSKTYLEPQFKPVREFVTKSQQKEVLQEWDALQKTYPGAAKYQQQITEFLQANQNVESLKAAYFAVAGDAVVEDARRAASRKDTVERAGAQVMRNGSASHETVPVDKKISLGDRFAAAFKRNGIRL